MAGRPRKMASKAAEFEGQAIQLSAEVFLTIPQQYRNKPNSKDPICQAWNLCMETTMSASVACEQLGDLLRAKAGITEPGPTKALLSNPPDEAEMYCDEGDTEAQGIRR